MRQSVIDKIPGIEAAKSVCVVDAASLTKKEFQERYIDHNIPCLIKDAVKFWPARDKWTDKDYLLNICGEQKTRLYKHINYADAKKMKSGVQHVFFAEALNNAFADDKGITSIPQVVGKTGKPFSELRVDIGQFPFLPDPPRPLYYPDIRVFFFRNTSTGWHLHAVDETLMCQVMGAKNVALLPSDTPEFGMMQKIFGDDSYLEDATQMSCVASKITPYFVTVEEGDALYIPPFWWHGVDTVDDQFGATVVYCWRSPWHKVSNFRYPSVRGIWEENFRKISLFTPLVLSIGIVSIIAQGVSSIRNFIKESIYANKP